MRAKTLLMLAALILIVSQKSSFAGQPTTENDTSRAERSVSLLDNLAGSTIYEVNVRQFTEEGTLTAFAEHLPRLKSLGVDVLWFMPIYPISETNRKGTLGSYYAPSDYTSVNPEFGTFDDFQAVLNQAHNMGFKVILDWVPNHSGRDHAWIKQHPDYYVWDEKGELAYESMSPTDVWWDTALLNNYNPNTRGAMIDAMQFWVDTGVDGFRLDHGCGDKIPLYLWEEARAQLDPIKDLFLLSECGHQTHILDGSYADEFEVIMRDVAAGHKPVNALSEWISEDMFKNGRSKFRLTYTTNHDLNSWIGTVFERFGEGHKAFAVLSFTAYGFPLILSGQEVGLDKRLEFFEKDPIDWADPNNLQSFYQSLVTLKKQNPALWAGSAGGFFEPIDLGENVFAFKRAVEGNRVVTIINLSDEAQSVTAKDPSIHGSHTDFFTGNEVTIDSSPLSLKSWQYLVFTE